MEQRGIIEEYMNRVYKIVVVLLVASCSIAGVIYGAMKAIGLYLFFQEEPYGVFSFIFLFLVDCLLISNFS